MSLLYPNASAHLGRRHDWVYSLVRVTDNIEVITPKFMTILAITAKEKHRVLGEKVAGRLPRGFQKEKDTEAGF